MTFDDLLTHLRELDALLDGLEIHPNVEAASLLVSELIEQVATDRAAPYRRGV